MKQSWIMGGAVVVLMGLCVSCADPYAGGDYGGNYGSGAYPRNAAEAVVPIVVGAALIGALASNSNERARDRRRANSQFDERNWGGAYRGGGHHHGW